MGTHNSKHDAYTDQRHQGDSEELLRSWMKNDQAVKHGTKPGGAREDVHNNQNPSDELHFVTCRAAY